MAGINTDDPQIAVHGVKQINSIARNNCPPLNPIYEYNPSRFSAAVVPRLHLAMIFNGRRQCCPLSARQHLSSINYSRRFIIISSSIRHQRGTNQGVHAWLGFFVWEDAKSRIQDGSYNTSLEELHIWEPSNPCSHGKKTLSR